MRTSLRRTSLLLAAFAISTMSLTGCQTGSGFRMSSPSTWMSWSKKKPADTALSSTRPSTNLPDPPSSTATPSVGPSYAQASGQTSPTGQTSFASQPRSGNYYSNSSPATGYGNTRTASAANQTYAGQGTSPAKGFYSSTPSSSQTQQSTVGNTSYPKSPSSGSYAGGYGGDAYSPSYGPTSYGAAATASQPATAAAPSSSYSGTSGSYQATTPAGSAPGAYGQTGSGPSSYTPGTATGGSYASGASTYGGSGQMQSQPANLSYPSTVTAGPSTQQTAAPGTYRPGSTARATQFGSTSGISVPGTENVQPASFAGGSAAPSSPPAGATTPSSGSYGGGTYAPPAQTANPGSTYTYPDTYRR